LPLFGTSRNEPPVLRVAEVAQRIQSAIGRAFPDPVWVEGEVSNFRRQTHSGHAYFSLKDADTSARLDVVWFRSNQAPFVREMADGLRVRIWGEVCIYEPRSAYQIRALRVEPAGRGALYEALERLKARLAAEGLFDPARKRPLPRLPRCVGVATSPSGAALRDILRVIGRRFPNMPILVSPCRVQGEGAAADIAAAIDRLSARPDVEVVIVARGGGSIEDLWAYNEEAVVRAVARCAHPVVSGVGHETDITLTDLAADLRAPTPSAAAMAAVPDRAELERTVAQWAVRLRRAAWQTVNSRRARVCLAAAHPWFRDPRRAVRDPRERVRSLSRDLAVAARRRTSLFRQRLDDLAARARETLTTRQAAATQWLRALPSDRLLAAARRTLAARRLHAQQIDARLRALDPHAVLARGYSITRGPDGRLLRRADQVHPGDRLITRLWRGEVDSEVRTAKMDPKTG